MGGAESGVGAAVLAKVKGFDVFLSDNGVIKEEYARTLQQWDIPYEQGGHTPEKILNADEVVKSPGIPSTAPMVKALASMGTHIVSEIEFASRYDNAKKICITGSNGKTTTTSLIHYLLKEAGLNVGLGGNIGKSYALQVATEKHDYYVLEISSFQLDDTYDFRPDIAVITNITPDHLDRYDHKMENYVRAKFKIVRNLRPEDCFIFDSDDAITIEHRLEPVLSIKDVLYINDSKATNVDSAWYALECQTKPVVWIVGGKDKGNDYSVLTDLVKEKVKAIVCLGVDNSKIHAAFEDIVGSENITDTGSADAAVKAASRFASPGDVVLLSPCCASFDLFSCYEDRGEQFKAAVRNL